MKDVKNIFRKIYHFLLPIVATSIVLITASCATKNINASETKAVTESSLTNVENSAQAIDENGTYTSKDEVALYIYTYKKLPKNFIKKKAAEKLGWKKSKNNLYEVTGGKSIGGDKFANYEKKLPQVSGRTYYECDIDYRGGARGAKRIVYADDFDARYGFIFYTGDHYKSFEKLY